MSRFSSYHKVMRENFEIICSDMEGLSLGEEIRTAIEEWRAYDRVRGVPPGGRQDMTAREVENLFLEDLIRLGGFIESIRPVLEREAAAGGKGSEEARITLERMATTVDLIGRFKNHFKEKFS